MMKVLEKAADLAEETLMSNTQLRHWNGSEKPVLLTGGWKFEEVWARDFCFSVPALMILKKHETIRNTLEAIYHFQRHDGLFPRKLSSLSNSWRNIRVGLKRLGVHIPVSKKLTPEYKTPFGREPKDINPLVIKATADYAKIDPSFLKQNKEKINRALDYIESKSHNGLIIQNGCEDWADHTERRGKVLYTNANLFRALQSLKEHKEFSRRAEEMLANTEKGLAELWSDLAYLNSIDNNFRDTNIALPGNLLMLGVCETNSKILKKTLLNIIKKEGYAPIVTRPYTHKSTSLTRFFANKYNEGKLVLPWIQCLAVINLKESAEAEKLLEKTAKLIVSNNSCIEVALPDNRLLTYPMTTQEYQFSWTASMYIEAYHTLNRKEVKPA